MADLAPLPVKYLSDGSATYTTIDGDVVGLLCARHYGHEWNTFELVLESNEGLAELGPVLPAGVVVVLPVYVEPNPADVNVLSLYDD